MVTLEVAKQGAIYHGLATLLNQPSPMMQRSKGWRRSTNPSLPEPGRCRAAEPPRTCHRPGCEEE